MYLYVSISIHQPKKTKEVQYSARRMRFSPLGNDCELSKMSSQIHHPSSSTTSEQWLHNPCWLMVKNIWKSQSILYIYVCIDYPI